MPVARPKVSPGHVLQFLTLEVVVGDAEAKMTTEFEQPLPFFIHPADALQSVPTRALKSPSRNRPSDLGILDSDASSASEN